ncbi:MAG: SDR family NAD(P)-dependent oxidoreductase [Acidimicrobiales bacterium]
MPSRPEPDGGSIPGGGGPAPHWERALVTGASVGIGRAIALRLAAQGTALVLVARDRGALDQVAAAVPVPAEVLVADLADPEDVAKVADRIATGLDPVDLVVNNAGLGWEHDLADADPRREAAMVAVNVAAVSVLTTTAAAALGRRGRGGILNVSSVAGALPGAGSATYAATKAYVTSLTRSAHIELASRGVTVTALCPGLTRTEFHRRAGVINSAPGFLWQTADQVAAAGLEGVAAGKVTVVPGIHNRLGVLLAGVAPFGLVRAVVTRGRARMRR